MIRSYHRGSPVLIEVEFKKLTPFAADPAYYDPTTKTVTVTDPDSTDVVDAGALTKSAVGKYYHILQTTTGYVAGTYQVSVSSGDGSYTDVTTEAAAFSLV
jgi:hypothetical protein